MPDRPSGPLDAELEALAAARFELLVERKPVAATFLGRHGHDDRLGDISREAAEEDIGQTSTYIAALEALDGHGLSAPAAFERDIALWQARKDLFTMAELRAWERRPAAIDEIGDGLFSLFARDFAPLADRLESIAGRLEEAPRVLAQQPDVLRGRRVARWDVLELELSRQLPTFLDEIAAAARRTWSEGDARQRRLRLATSRAREALATYEAWLSETIDPDADAFALGREPYDELVGAARLRRPDDRRDPRDRRAAAG